MRQDRPTGPTWKCVGPEKQNEAATPRRAWGDGTDAVVTALSGDSHLHFNKCSRAPKRICEDVKERLKLDGVDVATLQCRGG